jgi:hypothetical protein
MRGAGLMRIAHFGIPPSSRRQFADSMLF